MPSPLRFIPPGGSLVEVTCRTVQRRLLLAPRPRLREILIGALARAQREHPLQIVAFACLSNHVHILAWADDACQLAGFMDHFLTKMAKEVNRLCDWSDHVWARRYRSIPVSNEPAVQENRLEYVLAQGAKENLVASPREWPGAHAVNALLTGEPLKGVWYDRTQEYRARYRGKEFGPEEYAEEETLTLVPLPCLRDLTPEQYREKMAEIVARIEEEARKRREEAGLEPLGVAAVQTQHPHTRPNRTKKSPAPLFHAWSKRAYRELYEAYGRFVAAFREASEKLRSGDRTAVFPEGSFPPALPFVRGVPALALAG